MPYSIEKRERKGKDKFCLIRENGSIKSCHNTKELAKSVRNALMGLEHGTWKPTGEWKQ